MAHAVRAGRVHADHWQFEIGWKSCDAGAVALRAWLPRSRVALATRQSKPFAVIAPDKERHADDTADDTAHWTVRGIVRQKLVFQTRPQPVVVKS